jgi:hypothetical protein
MSYQIPASAAPPEQVFPKTNHVREFEEICKECNVNPVNHGEFEKATDLIVDIA